MGTGGGGGRVSDDVIDAVIKFMPFVIDDVMAFDTPLVSDDVMLLWPFMEDVMFKGKEEGGGGGMASDGAPSGLR